MGEDERRRDRDLVQRFRGGDREAFAELYRAHFPGVFRFVLSMTGNRVRAGETVQDVFVWLVRHAGEFDDARGDLGAFLGGVARKLLQRKRQAEQRWLPLDEGAASLQLRSDDSSVAGGLEREQDAAQLRKAIAALPEKYREAVVFCDLQGKSYEEAAAAMECAVGTVRSRLHRARELLVRKFQCREGQRCL
jgi:RNA polymerase sigma-70 factor (ECF subfamily)